MYTNRKNNHYLIAYTVLFLVTAGIGYGSTLLKGHSLIWQIDGIGQYYPAFLYIGEYFRTFLKGLLQGRVILPMYDLSIGFGEDIIGTLNYYGLGDPLNLLAVFATKANGAYLFTALFFVRGWISGFVFLKYLEAIGYKKVYTVGGALTYAFCGFAVFGAGRYSQWYDLMIVIPLLLLGCESVLNKRRKGCVLLAAGAAYTGFCSIYFLYIAAIVLVFYCPLRLLARYGWREWKLVLKNCFLLLFVCILGTCICAPVLFPEISCFFGSENAEYSLLDALLDVRNYTPVSFPYIWYSLLNPVYTVAGYSYAGGIHIFETAAVLFLCIKRKKTVREKLYLGVLAAEIAGLYFPIVGLVFNAFNETNYRWIVIVHLTLAIIFTHCFQCVCEQYCNTANRKRNTVCGISLLTVINIGLIIFLSFSPRGLNCEARFIFFKDSYSVYVDSPAVYSDSINNDKELYRISATVFTKINRRPPNSAMLGKYNSLQYWFSISNTNTQRLVDYSYGDNQIGRSYGVNRNRYLNSLLGVKYYLSRKKNIHPDGFERIEKIRFNAKKWYVFENRHYNGMAYLRDGTKADEIWARMLNGKNLDGYFKEIYRLYSSYAEKGHIDLKYGIDTFHCTVEASDGDELILAVPYHKNWKAYVDGKRTETTCRDIMFTAIALNAGEHEVSLRYISYPFIAGCICAGTVWIICISLALMSSVRQKQFRR